LASLLIGLHDGLLLLGQHASFLAFELFHALIVSPRTLEVALACLAKLLALFLEVSSARLL